MNGISSVGQVHALWRYPVKSMQGEPLDTSLVTDNGLLGDRAFWLYDEASGKVALLKQVEVRIRAESHSGHVHGTTRNV